MDNLSLLGLRVENGQAVGAMNQYTSSAQRAERQTGLFEGALGRLTAAFGVYQAIRAVQQTLNLADSFKNMQAQLQLVTTSSAELVRVQGELFDVSQLTRTALESNVSLFASLSRSTKDLGLSQQQLIDITKTVSQSFLISGASASETNAAIRQLSQALASGVLRGDEFNSIAENAPRLQRAVAESLGVTIGQLRAMAAEGKVTAEVMTTALLKSGSAINNEFSKVPITVSGAFTVFRNSLTQMIGDADKATGVSATLAGALVTLANNLGLVAKAALATSIALGVQGLIGIMPKLVAAVVLAEHRLIGLSAAIAAARVAGTGIGGVLAGMAPVLGRLLPPLALVSAAFGLLTLATHDAKAAIKLQAEGAEGARKEIDAYRASIEGLSKAQLEAQLVAVRSKIAETPGLGTQLDFRRGGGVPRGEVEAMRAIVNLRAQEAALMELLLPKRDREAAITADIAKDNADRLRLAQQALDLAKLEGAAAAHLAVEHRAINELQKVRDAAAKSGHTLSDAELAATRANVEAAKALWHQEVEINQEKERRAEFEKQFQAFSQRATEFAQDALRAAQDHAQAEAEKAKSAAEYMVSIREQTLAAEQQVQLIGVTGKTRERDLLTFEKLRREAENVKRFGGENVQLLNEADAETLRWYNAMLKVLDAADDTRGVLADGISQALSAASGLVSVLGESGRELGSMVALAAQFATNLSRVQSLKNDKGEATTFGTAISGAAGAAAAATAISSALGMVGAVVSIGNALGLFSNKAAEERRKIEQAAIQFQKALEGFSRTRVASPEQKEIGTALDIARQNATALGLSLNNSFNFESLEQFRDLVNKLPFGLFRDNLEALLITTGKNIAAIEKETAASKAREAADKARADAERQREAAHSQAELGIELLRAQGSDTLADAAQFQLRYNDAVLAGRDALHLSTLQQIEAANIARKVAEQEKQDAEDRLRQLQEEARLLEANTRFREGLVGRGLDALGNSRGAEDASRAASQRQELVDAIEAGMTETNIALLKFVQFAERERVLMLRAIEDGTKAIQESAAIQLAEKDRLIKLSEANLDAFLKSENARIDAINAASKLEQKKFDEQIDLQRASLDVAKEQVSILSNAVSETSRVVDALRNFNSSLPLGNLSTLSPLQQAAEARRQFEEAARSAVSGDKGAAGNLPGIANAFLEASRKVNASGAGFVSDFNRVRDIVAQVTSQFGGQLSSEQAALAAAQATVTNIEKEIEILQAAKDEAKERDALKIAAIRDLMEAARENSRIEIDSLNAQKEQIGLDTQRQIDELVRVETTLFEMRVASSEYYEESIGLLGQGNLIMATGLNGVRAAVVEVSAKLDETNSRLKKIEDLQNT